MQGLICWHSKECPLNLQVYRLYYLPTRTRWNVYFLDSWRGIADITVTSRCWVVFRKYMLQLLSYAKNLFLSTYYATGYIFIWKLLYKNLLGFFFFLCVAEVFSTNLITLSRTQSWLQYQQKDFQDVVHRSLRTAVHNFQSTELSSLWSPMKITQLSPSEKITKNLFSKDIDSFVHWCVN